VALTPLESSARDEGATFADHDLTLYFDSARSSTDLVYRTTRPDRASPFTAPIPLTPLGDVEGVALSSDDSVLFGTTVASGDHIVQVTGYDTAMPVVTTLVQFPSGAGYPTLTADDLQMYYTQGGQIYRASRAELASAWVIDGVDTSLSASTDTDVEISRDGTIFMFASGRGGSNTTIYMSTRACE
jgi:hypothetical protein